mmetsp:Transcript_25600/g.33323  ORF Transcript_25600/g.33323 Transcript_25600/m.33323 type:complete len:164 (+) Transcript_25600:17-508(+)
MAALAMTEDDNIWVAASDGDMEKVQAYITTDSSAASIGDENGYTAIHAAAAYGHHDLINYLVSVGADIHQRDNDGDTPLHHCDAPATAEFLISLGANPLVANNEGRTPPQVHLSDDEEEMVEFWRAKGFLEKGPIVTMVPGSDFPEQGELESFDEMERAEEEP